MQWIEFGTETTTSTYIDFNNLWLQLINQAVCNESQTWSQMFPYLRLYFCLTVASLLYLSHNQKIKVVNAITLKLP